MAYIPFVQEQGAIYSIVNGGGADVSTATAVLNDPASGSYCGMLSEITGLDSPEVRESTAELVEADGGSHGKFYFGRRPITMTIRVFGHTDAEQRATRIDRLHRACTALRNDTYLRWTPTYAGAIPLEIPVRLQQPIRDTGPWNKEVQVSLVAATAVIVGQTENDSGTITSGAAATVCENKGSYRAYPTIRLTGISTNPVLTIASHGTLRTGPTGYTLNLAAGETLEVDTLTHQATFIAGARNGESGNRYINWATTTTWPYLLRGNNSITLTGGGTAQVLWRDTWH